MWQAAAGLRTLESWCILLEDMCLGNVFRPGLPFPGVGKACAWSWLLLLCCWRPWLEPSSTPGERKGYIVANHPGWGSKEGLQLRRGSCRSGSWACPSFPADSLMLEISLKFLWTLPVRQKILCEVVKTLSPLGGSAKNLSDWLPTSFYNSAKRHGSLRWCSLHSDSIELNICSMGARGIRYIYFTELLYFLMCLI